MTKNFLNNMLYNRQRALLGVIDLLNKKGITSKLYLMKTLFLIKQEIPSFNYDFYPYKLGPYSRTVYWDLDYLKKQDLIEANEKVITLNGKKEVRISDEVVNKVNEIINKFSNKDKIKDFVYEKYPGFTENSILLPHKKTMQKGRFTIGYEGKSIDFFVNQLVQNKVTKLIDVRKNAFSMKRGFSKTTLRETVESAGIVYEHVPMLGIDSDKRQMLETKEDYEKLFKAYRVTLPKREVELNYIKSESERERIAIMCFEKDPSYCHRGQISDFVGGFEHL